MTGEKIDGEIFLQLPESDVTKIIKPIGDRYKFFLNRDKRFVTFTNGNFYYKINIIVEFMKIVPAAKQTD